MTLWHALEHFFVKTYSTNLQIRFLRTDEDEEEIYTFYIIVLVKEVINYTKDNDVWLLSVLSRYKLVTVFRIFISEFWNLSRVYIFLN